MRVLDLYCCAGGASVGYKRAGYDVTGVDIVRSSNYPYRFTQADALSYLRTVDLAEYDLIHASPPCQNQAAITKGTNAYRRHLHADLYPETRQLLEASGLPYVIENPSARPDIVLCGEMFGLAVIRHRKFELGRWYTLAPAHIPHRGRVSGWRHGVKYDGPYVSVYGDGGGKGSVVEWQRAMGINWTNDRREIAEAIPPAYTLWLGEAFKQFQSAAIG